MGFLFCLSLDCQPKYWNKLFGIGKDKIKYHHIIINLVIIESLST